MHDVPGVVHNGNSCGIALGRFVLMLCVLRCPLECLFIRLFVILPARGSNLCVYALKQVGLDGDLRVLMDPADELKQLGMAIGSCSDRTGFLEFGNCVRMHVSSHRSVIKHVTLHRSVRCHFVRDASEP